MLLTGLKYSDGGRFRPGGGGVKAYLYSATFIDSGFG